MRTKRLLYKGETTHLEGRIGNKDETTHGEGVKRRNDPKPKSVSRSTCPLFLFILLLYNYFLKSNCERNSLLCSKIVNHINVRAPSFAKIVKKLPERPERARIIPNTV